MPFYIGDFSKPINPSHVIHLKHPSQAETLKDGDVVERWDHIFEWDSNCLKGSELEEWRSTGDPMCDEALESMFLTTSSSAGIDLLERLQSDAASSPGGPSQTLLETVSCPPPDDIAASPSEILRAQAFFLRHSVAIMRCLLHFSLAGGFARWGTPLVVCCLINFENLELIIVPESPGFSSRYPTWCHQEGTQTPLKWQTLLPQ